MLTKAEKKVLSVVGEELFGMSFKIIQEKACETEDVVKNALGMLIQRKYVKYEIRNNCLLYFVNSAVVDRVKYNFIYLSCIEKTYDAKTYALFKQVLLEGIKMVAKQSKELEKLLSDELIVKEYIESNLYGDEAKHQKLSTLYYSVNYEMLEKYVAIQLIEEILKETYCLEMSRIFRYLAVNTLKNDKVNVEEIVEDIQNTLGFTTENVRNIVEYLQGLELIDFDLKTSKRLVSFLQTKYIDFMLTDITQLRLFNMIRLNSYGMDHNITDKEITVGSLLPIVCQKISVFELLAKGLIYEECTEMYKIRQKVEHIFKVNEKYSSRSIERRLEEEMDGNTTVENMSKLCFLHFVYTLQLNK